MYSTFLRQIYFAFPPPLRVSLPTCLPPRRSTPILMPHLRASKPPERRGKGRKKLARHRAVRSRYQRFAYSVLLHESLAHYLRSRLRGHLPFRFICTRECGQKMSPMPSTPSLRCSEIRSPDGADIVWLHSAIPPKAQHSHLSNADHNEPPLQNYFSIMPQYILFPAKTLYFARFCSYYLCRDEEEEIVYLIIFTLPTTIRIRPLCRYYGVLSKRLINFY